MLLKKGTETEFTTEQTEQRGTAKARVLVPCVFIFILIFIIRSVVK
jgi:hypothetical protein